MRTKRSPVEEKQSVFVGIDMHRRTWHVTVRTEHRELFNGSLPGRWDALEFLLGRYRKATIHATYEAGYFGYWLHDRLIGMGARCVVTPPSLIPQEPGNRVKTDRKDSRKLAVFLAKGLLKAVWVPDEQARAERQVSRRRRQLIGDRTRTQNRIKAELRFYGVELQDTKGAWSRVYVDNLRRLRFSTRWLQESFTRLLEEYEFLTTQITKQTQLLKSLAASEAYREKVQLLQTIPGVGLIAAMEILLELGDITRFARADQLASYVGLTPSQYSSAEKIRMGSITRSGKPTLRAILIESAWRLVDKDQKLRAVYERVKQRAGGKRAIVAVSRRLLLIARRILLDRTVFRPCLTAA